MQETNLGLDMNDTHQVLAYADDVNLIGDDVRILERNAVVLLHVIEWMNLAKHPWKGKASCF